MEDRTWFANVLEELESDLDFITEEMAFDYVNEIRRAMALQDVSKAELARRTGKSRAYITKVLNYNPNLTIRSLAMIAHALNLRWAQPRLTDRHYDEFAWSITRTASVYCQQPALEKSDTSDEAAHYSELPIEGVKNGSRFAYAA